MKDINKILKQFDRKEFNPDQSKIDRILKNISNENPLKLIIFTCSTINAKNMFNINKFDEYVSLDPKGNNLSEDIYIVRDLLNLLDSLRLPYTLSIIIGNTDPYYIYSQQIELLPDIKRNEYFRRMNNRWLIYKYNFSKWVSGVLSEKSNYKIISWYEFEENISKNLKWNFDELFNEVKNDYSKWFSKEDLEWELNKLKTNFGPEKYFENLEIPDEKILKSWVISKFCEYCIQGFWIYMFFPNAILLQNEKPTDIRYKMFQPLIKKYFNSELPNIYPFGIDNSGYQ